MAHKRRPDDHVLSEFLVRYYRELPDEDADDRRLDDAYAAAVTHLILGRVRAPGEVLVRVLSPKADRDGWRTERSVLMFVTDDIPFLVDTVRMVLDRYDLGIHLMVHPMLPITRNEAHEVTGFFDESDTEHTAGADVAAPMVEAWTLVELDRCTPEIERQLEADVARAIGEVVRVVGDFDAMRERMASVANGDPLLAWLGDQHFVLLGAASYDRTVGDDGEPQLTLQPGTELGEYRPDARLDPSTPYPPSKSGDEEIVIARTDAVATVHRPARMTCVAVRPAADNATVEHRFIGLLGSGAYRESVFAIPTVADRVNEVLAMAGVSEVSHTGRAVKNVVETLPRDLVFELDSHALAELVIDIVGLQERRIVRVFDVAEPVGPWTTVFVYVPRSRFDSELPERVCRLVERHYGSESRDLQTLLGSSSLARMTMTVRASESVDLERLAEAVDDISTTWDERAEAVICESVGDVAGRAVFTSIHNSIPSDYRASVVARGVGGRSHQHRRAPRRRARYAGLIGDLARPQRGCAVRPLAVPHLPAWCAVHDRRVGSAARSSRSPRRRRTAVRVRVPGRRGAPLRHRRARRCRHRLRSSVVTSNSRTRSAAPSPDCSRARSRPTASIG